MKSTVRFTDRQLATILAALRYWQREGLMSAGFEQDVATNEGTLEPLSAEEIDELCEEHINVPSPDASMLPEQSFEEALTTSMDAFWASLAERLPTITSGDFPPEATMAFYEACNLAARTWVDANLPAGAVIRTADGYGLTKTQDGAYTDGDLTFSSLIALEIDFDVLDAD